MNRIISVITSFIFICTCFVCCCVCASGDVQTEYGVIPAQYADESRYPVAVFKSNGELLKATAVLADNTGNCGLYHARSDYSSNQGKYVLMRADTSMTTYYPNINHHYNQENIIDLGGNTLTVTTEYMFNVYQRFTKDVSIIIKNGTIVYPGRIFNHKSGGNYTGSAKFNFTFENITFRLSEGSLSASAFTDGTSGSQTMETDIKLIDCTFDVSAKDSSADTVLFSAGSDMVTTNITVVGGKLVADECDSLTITSVNSPESSVVFTANDAGDYPKLVMPNTVSACTETIPADGGDALYIVADDDGEYFTYILKADFIDIPDILVNRVIFGTNSGFSAKGTVRNLTDDACSAVMIMTLYDAQGNIVGVEASDAVIEHVAELDASSDLHEAVRADVYFMKDWKSLVPMTNVIYSSDGTFAPVAPGGGDATGSTYFNIIYDASVESVVIKAEDASMAGEAVSINVVSSDGGVPSAENVPVISALYAYNDIGVFNAKIPLTSSVPSSKYTVYARSAGMNTAETATLLVYRADSDETKYSLNVVNKAEDFDTFVTLFEENSYSLGIDYTIETGWSTMLEVLWGVRESSGKFTAESLAEAADYARAAALIVAGTDVESVMQSYAASFGTSYEEYSALSDNTRDILNRLLEESDFTGGYIDYNSLYYTAAAAGSSSYEELRELVCDNTAVYGVDLDGDYDDLSASNKGKVFKRMYSEREGFKALADVAVSFDDAVEYYLSNVKKPSSGGGGGSSGGGGYTKITAPAPSVVPDDSASSAPEKVPETDEPVYSDIVGHFAKDDIHYLGKLGVINGYADGTFRPGGNVTRAELCKMISVAFDIRNSGNASFVDVAPDAWYCEYITSLASEGIVRGDGTRFHPDEYVTREDCAVILARATGKTASTDNGHEFADSESISEYARSAVAALASEGYMQGDGVSFRPKDAICRGEVAAVVARILKSIG